MDEWNKANKIGKDICDQIVSTYPQNAEAKELKAIIISVLNNAPNGVCISFMKEKYVNPILHWSKQNMNHQDFGVKAQKLRSNFLALDELLFLYQTEIKKGYAARYSDSAQRLNEGIKSMKNAIDYFDQCKTKYIVKHYI